MSRTRSVQDVGPVNPSSIFRTTDYRAVHPDERSACALYAWTSVPWGLGAYQGFFGGAKATRRFRRLRVLTGTREMYNFAHVTTDWPGAAGLWP
jgi:hypothetical protein